MAPARRHYAAIFLVSLSLLVLEIAVARILSVALYSHYAFVAVSLAMFGLGVSSLVVYLLPNHFTRERVDEQVVGYTRFFAVSVAISIAVFLQIPIVQSLSASGFVTLSLAYTVLAIPFFFGGVCIALLMTHFSAHIGSIYWADLFGASIGCLVVVILMQVLPAPQVALVTACLAAIVSFGLARVSGAPVGRSDFVTLGAVAALVLVGATTELMTMRYVKNWDTVYADYEGWNAFSRVSAFNVDQNAAQVVPLKNLAEFYEGDDYPATMMLDIDGAAWTPMMNYDGNLESIQFLRESVLYAAHHIRPNTDVLIIGTGGGRDLLAAAAFEQKTILGIELNPLMREIVQERYGDYSGRPYTLPNTHVVVDEARSRLHQIDREFGIIQLSLIDTFSLNAAGGFVFSENNLYTRQAFQQYYRHLTDDGILSITRYFVEQYPVEILKTLNLMRAAWAAEGVASIEDRVLVLRVGMSCTVLVKKTKYSDEELALVDAMVKENGFRVLYGPGRWVGHQEVVDVIRAPDPEAFAAAYPYRIEAPTDDRPFFFSFLRDRLEAVPTLQEDPFQFLRLWNDAINLVYMLIAVVTTLATIFFFGPLLLLARRGIGDVHVGSTMAYLLYFALLGYGFMMIEIPLLQQFILFLGYPVYALAVVLFALLLFSGTGSLLTTRFDSDPRRALTQVLVAIVAVSLVYAYALPKIIELFLGVSIMLKIPITVGLLAPVGLLLGMAYPLGIGVLREESETLVPWAWGMNGAMSVVASVLATFIGSRVGFTAALLTGIAAYGFGLACIVLTGGRSATSTSASTSTPR